MDTLTGRGFESHARARLSRRDLLKVAGTGALGLAALGMAGRAGAADAPAAAKPEEKKEGAAMKGRIKQSVCKWCYGKIPMAEFCPAVAKMGIKGIDLVGSGDFAILKANNLVATMIPTGSIPKGFNRKENHAECLKKLRDGIEAAAANGYPNAICFSGNREGMADDVGQANCVEGLKQIAAFAEEKKVTVCMELLNSINHKDYMCDSTAWADEMCKKVGSPRVKILYDIYHSAMMKEDVIPTLQKHIGCVGHVHTGGYPGRNDIDETQKLDYKAIMLALVELKYDGWVAHEFLPKAKDAAGQLAALAKAVQLCDV
jgi:hydroxypyruvate isomerase